MRQLNSKLKIGEELISASDMDEKDVRSTAKSLGCRTATPGTERSHFLNLSEPYFFNPAEMELSHVRQYVTDLVEHLSTLVKFVEDEFKPT